MADMRVIAPIAPAGGFAVTKVQYIEDGNGVRLDTIINEQTSRIAAYKADIDNLKSGLATVQTNLTENNEKIATNKTDIANLKTGLATVQSSIVNKEEKILHFKTWADYEKVKNTIPVDTYFVIEEDAGEDVYKKIEQIEEDIAVQTARIDQLVGTVPPGSGDEVADARVMVDGKTANNLGTAIRSQVTRLKEQLDAVETELSEANNLFFSGETNRKINWVQGYWSTVDKISANATLCCNEKKIFIAKGDILKIRPNGLYVLMSDTTTGTLEAFTADYDGIARVSSAYYTANTITIKAIADMSIVIRVAKDASHAGNIIPSECNINVSYTRYAPNLPIATPYGTAKLTATWDGSTFSLTGKDFRIFSVTRRKWIIVSKVDVSRASQYAVIIVLNTATDTIELKSTNDDISIGYELIEIWYNEKIADISNGYVEYENPSAHAGYIASGGVWMFVSNSKLIVKCDANARASLKNEILNISSFSTEIALPNTSLLDIVLTKDGFRTSSPMLTSNTDSVVAIVYGGYVTSFQPEIFTNCLPIPKITQREDIPTFFNNKKIGYEVEPRNSQYAVDYGYFCKITNGYRYAANPLTTTSKSGKYLYSSEKFLQNTSDISNKKILCVGDSITKRGWYQDRISSYASGITWIGTQDTYHGQTATKCEGYSGKTAKYVLIDETSPFKDGFDNYCTLNGKPDYVVVEFGLNEINAVEYATAVRTFISQVKAYDPNIVIYVLQPFNAAQIAATNHTSGWQRTECDKCVLESYSFTDCVLIPSWFIMVDEYDYEAGNVDYGYGNVTVVGTIDGVHPSESVGFAKIGDHIYNYLGM